MRKVGKKVQSLPFPLAICNHENIQYVLSSNYRTREIIHLNVCFVSSAAVHFLQSPSGKQYLLRQNNKPNGNWFYPPVTRAIWLQIPSITGWAETHTLFLGWPRFALYSQSELRGLLAKGLEEQRKLSHLIRKRLVLASRRPPAPLHRRY